MKPVVHLQSATVSYDGKSVLHDVTLTVRQGEFISVLGANGSGKSTLVKAIVGLVPLAAGSRDLFGIPGARFRPQSRLGYVPQRTGAGTGVPATVQEVVATGRLAIRGFGRVRTADRVAVDDAIDVVDLGMHRHRSVATLSGGQQQRALIARALAAKPELLVLDEPTAGVDLVGQQTLADALRALSRNGTTLILVTHELGPMRPLVSRAVTMSYGRAIHDGPPPEADHTHLHDPHHAHPVHEAVEMSARTWGLS